MTVQATIALFKTYANKNLDIIFSGGYKNSIFMLKLYVPLFQVIKTIWFLHISNTITVNINVSLSFQFW